MIETRRLALVIAGDDKTRVEQEFGTGAWRVLADNGFVERKTVSCVGFRRNLEENSLLVVLPKAFGGDQARAKLRELSFEREQIYRLLRIFKKIRRETRLETEPSDSNRILSREASWTDPVLDSFEAALRLREDYRRSGLYFRKTEKPAPNAHHLPINWPRTLRKNGLILTGADVMIRETIHIARRRDMFHPLTLLHISCLKEIFALTGEKNELNQVEGLDPMDFRAIKHSPRRLLRSLRARTFDERGRFLISAIKSFLGEARLAASKEADRDELLGYTKDFEDIWEHVLRDLLAPGLKDRRLPKGEWHEYPDKGPGSGITPEYDIRFQYGELDVLLDAKDYRLINGSRLLGTPADHYKQIIYRLLMSERKGDTVVNILAFPGLDQKRLFAIRGCHRWKDIPNSRVFEITVDYDLAMKRWLSEIALDVKAEVSELIESMKRFDERLNDDQ